MNQQNKTSHYSDIRIYDRYERSKTGCTAAAAERRLRSTVLEATQDLLLADIAVTHQQELEQVVVLFLLTRLRRAGLTCSHNTRLSQTLSILQAALRATLALLLLPL